MAKYEKYDLHADYPKKQKEGIFKNVTAVFHSIHDGTEEGKGTKE